MLSDALLEKVALFYYFALLDEAKAQAATSNTIKSLLKAGVGESTEPSEADIIFVRETSEFFNKSRSEHKTTSFSFSAGHIVLPEKSNWGPWFEFRKMADERDYLAVLYEKVLGVKEDLIAKGLKLPIGTVRHRLGRGLKVLGRICQSSGIEAIDA